MITFILLEINFSIMIKEFLKRFSNYLRINEIMQNYNF